MYALYNIIIVILVIIVILYLLSIYKEDYSNFYKKNSDLDYISSRGKIPKKLYKSPLAPITNRKVDKIVIPGKYANKYNI